MKKSIACQVATCGPIGEIRFAPGSFASLLAVPLIVLTGNNTAFFLVTLCVLVVLGIWTSSIAARDLGQHDPSNVVIDEVCGMFISFFFVPLSWQVLTVGFLAFRFFDIVKPPPVRFFERFPAGWGIVLDDIAAGIYANLVLQVLIRYAHL